MINDSATGAYKPYNFKNISDEVPEIKKFGYNFSSIEFDNPVDSSNITPSFFFCLSPFF